MSSASLLSQAAFRRMFSQHCCTVRSAAGAWWLSKKLWKQKDNQHFWEEQQPAVAIFIFNRISIVSIEIYCIMWNQTNFFLWRVLFDMLACHSFLENKSSLYNGVTFIHSFIFKWNSKQLSIKSCIFRPKYDQDISLTGLVRLQKWKWFFLYI